MPPLWDNELVVDITIPSNGSLTPGSGTVYIGGPQLVNIIGLNVAQYKSAIVWFTDASGLAQGVDYWFMAHFSDATFDGVRQGYYPTGGPTTISSIAQYIVSGVHNSILESPQGNAYLKANNLIQIESQGSATNFQAHATNNIFLDADFDVVLGSLSAPGRNSFLQAVNQIQVQTTNGQIYLMSGLGVIDFLKNSSLTETLEIKGLGTKPYIKAQNSATVDTWIFNTTGGVNINGSLNCTTNWAWYLTPDFRLELHWFIQTAAGNFPLITFLTVPIPAGLNLPQPHSMAGHAPLEGPYGVGQGNSVTVSCRIDSGAGVMYVFINGTASNFFSGGIQYQVDKP